MTQYIHHPWTFCEDLSHDYKLSDESFRHLFHVLRIGEGAEIISFDGCGRLRLGRLHFSKKAGSVEFLEPMVEVPVPKMNFNLVQCLPNNMATFEDILRKACELGIQNIYPVLSERTERAAWRSELWNKRQERFQRILQESCKQAKNPFLPRLHAMVPWNELPKMDLGGCYFGSVEADFTAHFNLKTEPLISCIVGPEGGFSTQEEIFLRQFAIPIHLPTCIMRVETAVVALAAVLKSQLECVYRR